MSYSYLTISSNCYYMNQNIYKKKREQRILYSLNHVQWENLKDLRPDNYIDTPIGEKFFEGPIKPRV